MQKTSKAQSRIVIILMLIIISTFFSGIVFAEPKIIRGLKPTDGTDNAYCEYDSTTKNCVLDLDQQFVILYIVGDGRIFIEGVEKPNLIISSNSLFLHNSLRLHTNCISQDSTDTNCMTADANLTIIDFNSIVVDGNQTIIISPFAETRIQISGHIKISENAAFYLQQYSDINQCIRLDPDTWGNPLNNSDMLYLPEIDLSETKIENFGNLFIESWSIISAASAFNDTNQCLIDGNNYIDMALKVNNKIIEFGDVNNIGNMQLTGLVFEDINSIEDVLITEPIFEINFNKFSGRLPSQFRLYSVAQNLHDEPYIQNYAKIALSTCDRLTVPQSPNYNGICTFYYARDSNAYTDLNQQNIGIDNNKIISLNNSCKTANIGDQIAHYLFTSKSQIKSNPIIFGTINSSVTKLPININLQTGDTNQGLYNINNLNQQVSTIQNQENTFFKIFSNNYPSGIDVNLLDTYLFRFKLLNNPGSETTYPDIKLDYPFKIHK